MTRRAVFLPGVLLLLIALSATQAHADLSQKQARKLIRTMAGLSLPSDSVRVGKINMAGAAAAETTAEIEMVFRLTQKEEGHWRLNEIRTGDDRWEPLEVIAQAAKFDLSTGDCDEPTQLARSARASELSVKRARCLIAGLFGVILPSDEVRIKKILMGLPLGSKPSALAVALVQIDFRMGKDGSGWHVLEFRSGNRGWTNLAAIPAAIDQVKRSTATAELNMIAKALEAFRRDRGFFVVSDKESVLIDHLSPRYLGRVTRFDPWHRPYQYQGEGDRFALRSVGPDGKVNTGDDVVVSGSNH